MRLFGRLDILSDMPSLPSRCAPFHPRPLLAPPRNETLKIFGLIESERPGLHIFLHGALNVGKSTAISKTLDILTTMRPLKIGGFMSWRSKDNDRHVVFIRPAMPGREHEKYLLAVYYPYNRSIDCDPRIFDKLCTRLLEENPDADFIVMDELGFLERRSFIFQQAVLSAINGDIPIIGVLRSGNIPWHKSIKSSPRVSLCEITLENRDALPRELAARLTPFVDSGKPPHGGFLS